MDKGHDSDRVHAETEARGVHPVVPLKGTRGKQLVLPTCERASRLMPHVPRASKRFHDLYRRRGAVERAFADLKTHHGPTPLRVRGQAKVQLYADLTIIGRFALALSRSREVVPLAA